jgi:hypothetical protein
MATNLRDRGFSSSTEGYKKEEKKQELPVSVQRYYDPKQAERKQQETQKGPVSVLKAEQLSSAATNGRAVLSEKKFNLTPALQKSYGNYQNYLAGRRVTESGFYSRPEVPFAVTNLYNQMGNAQRIAEMAFQNVQTAEEKYRGVKKAQDIYRNSVPNTFGNAMFDSVRSPLEHDTIREYNDQANLARKAYGNYLDYREKYVAAIDELEKADSEWRSHVRDRKTVRAGIDETDRLILETQKEINSLQQSVYTRTGRVSGNPEVLAQLKAEEANRLARLESLQNYQKELVERRKLQKEELEWSWLFEQQGIMDNEDFNALSVFDESNRDEFYRMANQKPLPADPYLGQNLPVEISYMSPDEIKIYNYIVKTQGLEAGREYYDALQNEALNARRKNAQIKQAVDFANSGPVQRHLANQLTTLMAPLKALTYLGQSAEMATTGHMSEDAGYQIFSYLPAAIRQDIAQNVEKTVGGTWGKVGSKLYMLGMSLMDFLFTALISGHYGIDNAALQAFRNGSTTAEALAAGKAFQTAEAISLGIMGTGAAADETIEAKERGLTDAQAYQIGTIAGIAEIFTEKVSIDALFKNLGTMKGWKYITANALPEMEEEMAADLINWGADVMIAGTQSKWQKSIDAYKEKGLSDEKAFQKALLDKAIEIGESGAGGLISGAALGAANLSENNAVYSNYLKSTEAESDKVWQLVEAGKVQPEDTRAFKAAEELSRKLESGETVSLKDAMRAANTINKAIDRDLRSGLAENIGRNLLTEQMRPALEQSIDYLLATKRSSQTYKLGQALLNKLNAGEQITAQEAGEAFLQAEKVASGDIGIRMERNLQPREVTPDMDELERSAAIAGISKAETARVRNVAKVLGRRVLFESVKPENGTVENGHIRDDGTIIINAYGVDPVMQVLSHEVTHDLEMTETYQTLAPMILERIENIDEERARLEKLYGTDNREKIDKELVAFYVQENLLQNERAIYEVVNQSRSFGQWMLDKIDDLLAKLGNENAKERAFLRKARRLYAKALQEKGTPRDGEAASYTGISRREDQDLRDRIRDIEDQLDLAQFNGLTAKDIRQLNGQLYKAQSQLDQFTAKQRALAKKTSINEIIRNIKDYDRMDLESLAEQVSDMAWDDYDELSDAELRESLVEAFKGRLEDMEPGDADKAKYGFYVKPPQGKVLQLPMVGEQYSYAEAAETDETDRAYLDALNKGDMETAQRMVDDAAERAMPDSKLRTPDGKLRRMFHGTKSGKFHVFDHGMIGTASGDTGYFGKGFYFAYTKGEAGMYGRRVLDAYLNIKNPFNFQQELSTLDGMRSHDYNGGRAAFIVNFAEKFPELTNGMVVYATERDGTDRELSYPQFAKEFREILNNVDFRIQKGTGEYGDEWIVTAGEHENSWTNDEGKTFTWKEYDYQSRTIDKASAEDKIAHAIEYMKNVKYSYLALQNPVVNIMESDFSGELQRRGYDGVIQSEDGDEAVVFDSAQIKLADPVTYDDNGNVIPLSERFNPDNPDIRYSYAEEEDSQGRKLSENQAKFFEKSKARDEQGRLLTLYHQTENDFTVFDPRHEGAGTRDNQTPYGIFLKSNTRDIGVRGKKQMALYANITNPLVVENRTALEGRLREMSPEYADLSDQHRRLDSEYQKRFDEAQKKFRDFLTAWRAEHPDAGRTDVYEAEGFESAFGAADEVLKEWEAAARELETKTKNVITQVLEAQGYDGLFLQKDQGAWGRSTDAVVALRPEQVKNIDNQNPTKDKDIRYSLSETDSNGVVLTRQQAEYFKDSKARDKEGNLLTLYNGGFGGEVYGDRGAGLTYGLGRRRAIYMTDVRQVADAYGSGRSELTNELYANLKNPLILDAEGRNYTDIPIPDDAPESLIEMYEGIDDEITADADSLPDYAWENGYDGVIIYNVREGVGGGPMTEVIALSSEQVKRTDNEAPTDDRNIRYSLTEEPKGLELPSVDGGRVAPAGAQETDGRLSLPKIEAEETEETKKPKTRKKPPKPVAESKPILARNWLDRQIMDQFGIRENKTEASKIIQQYADKVLREGAVTDVDVGNLFGQLYDRGVFEIFPDSYSKAMRDLVTQGNIYITDSVRADFGDDWADFRRKAFAAGIMLTNTRSISNAKALGVDQIYKELSDMSPGLFPADEYDERTMLEKIVQAAENGKSRKMTLPEYLNYMQKTEGEDMFETADRMMDKIAEDMRTFGEMAGLEIKLRDRTGVKIAQERERFGELREKQFQKISKARQEERERFRETTQRLRERKQISELQQKTLKQLQWLSKNRYRAPEELRGTWDELLGDLDIYAVHAADELHYSKKHDATYRDLIKMYKEARATDPNFLPSKELERIMSRVDGEHLEDLDVDSLKNLYQAITGLRTEFYNRNNAIMENETAALSDIFDETRKKMTAQRGYTDRAISRILNEESLTPMNALRRMVGWDKNSAWVQMAKQLEKGEKVRRDYKVRAERLLEDFLDENKDWFAKADGIGKDAIWYEVKVPEFMEFGKGNKPIFGDTVSVWMTPLQKVHMYLESKSYDNLRHMLGGRTFADKDLYSQGERARAFAAGRTIKLAPETVKYLVRDLSPEEMKLAKILENYYNVWSKGRINEVSNKLYGYDKAMNANYAPILTNQNYVGKELGVGDATAAGVGNLKARIYSKNPSYNVSAIEAFERSVDQTGKFVGMAIAESNWQKLLNWQVKGNSMRDVITHTWDKRGLDYIENLIETLQGNRSRDGKLVLGESTNKLLSNYISAVFGSNPGIVFKQAASYPQFAAVLGWSTAPNPKQFFKIDTDLINTYTSELAYRQMGYATPETAQLKNNPGILQKNKTLNFLFGGGAITAMDAATVKRGWAWAENAVKRDFPDLNKGTEAQIKAGKSEYYKKVAEYFEDAVSTTQPMYDEMHRPYIMKEAKGVARAFTMFKTVPMQQYNTLRRMWGEYDFARKQYQADSSAENKEQLRQAARGAANAVTATVGSVVALELVELLNQLWKNRAKGYRDDDDELTAESIGEAAAIKSVEDFAGMVPAGKEIAQILENLFMGKKWYGIEIPGGEQLNDFIETVQDTYKQIAGFVSGSIDVISNGEDWGQFMRRHAREYAGAVKDLAQKTAMYFGGLPLENLEKYFMGAVQFSPELTAAVEDAFGNQTRNTIKGKTGRELEKSVKDLFNVRSVEISEDSVKTIASLFENGKNQAVPAASPGSITIDGESVKLTEAQMQRWERVWAQTGNQVDDLIKSEAFKNADDETKVRMLNKLYELAKYNANLTVPGWSSDDTWQNKVMQIVDSQTMQTGRKIPESAQRMTTAGGTLADAIAWVAATSDMSDGKKFKYLAGMDVDDSVKETIFKSEKGAEMENNSGGLTAYGKLSWAKEKGLTTDQYLEWLAKFDEKPNQKEMLETLAESDMPDKEKLILAGTVFEKPDLQNKQGDTTYGTIVSAIKGGATVDDAISMAAAGATTEYKKAVKAGLSPSLAVNAAQTGAKIKEYVNQRNEDADWVDYSLTAAKAVKNSDEKLQILSTLMDPDHFDKVYDCYEIIEPEYYIEAYQRLREVKAKYDTDSVTQPMVTEALNQMDCSDEKKGILFHMLNKAWKSTKNNPYDKAAGQRAVEALNSAEAEETQEPQGLGLPYYS